MGKIFTAEIDKQLFEQYNFGNDLSKQKVVAKIFNPYGAGTWYLLNSDPEDPDYIWAIVDLFEVEIGSVSREELTNMKVPPFQLNLERDRFFQPINAEILYTNLLGGKQFKDGGKVSDCGCKHIEFKNGGEMTGKDGKLRYDIYTKPYRTEQGENDSLYVLNYKKEDEHNPYRIWDKANGEYTASFPTKEKALAWLADHQTYAKGGLLKHDNKAMLEQQLTTIVHHAKELHRIISNKVKTVEAWVVAKAERAATDLSDVAHYLENILNSNIKMAHGGETYAKGGGISRSQKEYNKNVDAYKYFIVDLKNKKAISGWEFRGDANDALTDYDGDKNFKVVAEVTLKSLGIENPKEKFKKMARGGQVTFDDKVSAIEKRLNGSAVNPKYQKFYGKTYDKQEAHEAAQKIVGASRAKWIRNN